MDSTLDDPSAADAALPAGDDLSAIAWVYDELRRTLDAAHKSLRRFIKDAEAVSGSDLDAVDPGVLRAARAQFHQGVGALELVGLPAPAVVLRASEAAVQRCIGKPQSLTQELVVDIERSSFALLDYLSRVLGGKSVSPLSLFPQYRAVQEAVDADRVHPADLWAVDWRWRETASDSDVVARNADAAVRAQLEGHLLQLMRDKQALTAAARMSEVTAGLASGSSHPHVRTFWNLAAAMFEAQHHGLLPFDIFSKRVASRLLAQFRILQRGDSDVSERLARDLLFFCAQAATPARGLRVPRLDVVRTAYGLPEQVPTDYSLSVLGRFDPAVIAHAKKRVASAKEAWSATAGGEMHRMAGLSEQFALVGDSLRKLFPYGESFATELQTAVAQTQQANAAPPAPLAMEVATSLLYIEAALEDGDFDDPDHADRVRRLAERLAAVRQQTPPEPLEAWMEELYRRVSDRQTMGSVVQELRASLSLAEKAIDAFFRDPSDAAVLVDVPIQLGSMRGVLSVLGMDQASLALSRMREEIQGLVSAPAAEGLVVKPGVFDRLAGNLSALGFMIDMLSVQPQLAKSLFVYDADAGTLAPVMGRSGRAKSDEPAPVEPRLIEQAQMLAFSSVRDDVPLQDVTRDLERLSHEAQAADQPGLAAAVLKAQEAIHLAADDRAKVTTARGELSEALVDFVATSTEPAGLMPVSEPMPLAPMLPITLVADFEHDEEMREVFLEEAREVVGDATAACAALKQSPGDLPLLTTLRRAFHTLKGSSRMVGLKAFGEAAWACEQVFNTELAEQREAEPALIQFAGWALEQLGAWVEAIAAGSGAGRNEGEIKMAADRVSHRLRSAEASSDIALPMGFPADLPSRDDLDLQATTAAAAPVAPASAAPAEPAEPTEPAEVAFELDLSGLDRLEPSTSPATPTANANANASADAAGSPMFERFDDARAEALQTTFGNARLQPDSEWSRGVDLDLGSAGEPTPLFEALAASGAEPSDLEPAAGAPADGDELVFDLSGGEAEAPALNQLDLDLRGDPAATSGVTASGSTASSDATASAAPGPEGSADEGVKIVGPLRIGIPLFNIYLNEADELSRHLMTEVAEWAMELHRPLGEAPIALAHSLAGSSATVGFTELSHLSRLLEHALARSQVIGHGTDEEARLFVNSAEEIRRLLHQFAAGFLKEPAAELLQRLADHELSSAKRLEAVTAADELAGDEDSELPVDAALQVETLLSIDTSQAVSDTVSPPVLTPPESRRTRARNEDEQVTEPAALDQVPHRSDVDAPSLAAAAAVDQPPTPAPAQTDFEPVASSFGALAPFGSLGLAELKPLAAAPTETGRPAQAPRSTTFGDIDDDIDSVDAVDLELFPIFEEEALDLLPRLAGQLRDWAGEPATTAHAAACMRTLHTLKGGARLAGAMRLGEMAHRLETRIERLTAEDASVDAADVEALQARSDGMTQAFDALRNRDAQAYADAVAAATTPLPAPPPPRRAASMPAEPSGSPPATAE
ncbi:MAG: Hpt domain-containing protein, partial [Pseudomonadota bacterium]|nr:Hpt domain-containing protein [Pseudomonadota bacterium]